VEIVTGLSLLAAKPLKSAEEFTSWVLPHLPAMTRLAARLSSDADRDDVVQEALLRAWGKRGQFDPRRGSPSAWLLAITADQARKSRRRNQVRSHPLHVHVHVKSIEDRLDLEEAVARLTGRQRLAVDCFYFVGLSVGETAAVMRCSEGTVKSTLADARKKLRSMLETKK
jgi:RNA polymerase sigma-70 factor (ECF subfamily)